jgi:hypothetical protein
VNWGSAVWSGLFTGYNNSGPYASVYAQSGLTSGLVDLVGIGSSVGIAAKSSAELQSITTYAGWSIAPGVTTSTVWGIDPTINGGFPFLQALPPVVSEAPPILQALPVNAAGTCADLADAHVAYQSGATGGWGLSWAQWANGGHGGPVCVRTLIYWGGRWVVES